MREKEEEDDFVREGGIEGAVGRTKWEVEHIILRQTGCNSTTEQAHSIINILTYNWSLIGCIENKNFGPSTFLRLLEIAYIFHQFFVLFSFCWGRVSEENLMATESAATCIKIT